MTKLTQVIDDHSLDWIVRKLRGYSMTRIGDADIELSPVCRDAADAIEQLRSFKPPGTPEHQS